MGQTASDDKYSVLAYSPNFSTRFLIDVSVDPWYFDLEFADNELELIDSVKNNTHLIYVIDATRAATARPSAVFSDVSALVLKHMIRIVAVLDKAPDDTLPRMADFGPLGIVAFDFSRDHINDALHRVRTMKGEWQQKRDTGSRVKADPDFYQQQRFKD